MATARRRYARQIMDLRTLPGDVRRRAQAINDVVHAMLWDIWKGH
jgi:hypothetical protein